jgi:hypothetical protein
MTGRNTRNAPTRGRERGLEQARHFHDTTEHPLPIATAHVAIPTPPRYMNRLAKHFEHRVAVVRDERSASVAFQDAPCTMQASDTHLDIRIEAADPATLTRIQDVVAKHLKQVAAKETFDVEWSVAG